MSLRMSVWQASFSCFISDSMHLMLFSCESTESLGADRSPVILADFMFDAATDTSNAWFASLRVLVFRHVKQDELSEKSSVQTGAV